LFFFVNNSSATPLSQHACMVVADLMPYPIQSKLFLLSEVWLSSDLGCTRDLTFGCDRNWYFCYQLLLWKVFGSILDFTDKRIQRLDFTTCDVS